MRVSNRFTRGTAAYKCRCCSRTTRDTGRGDNDNVGLCAECYDLYGYENMTLDGRELTARDKERVKWLVAVLADKRAKTSQWDALLTRAI